MVNRPAMRDLVKLTTSPSEAAKRGGVIDQFHHFDHFAWNAFFVKFQEENCRRSMSLKMKG